MLHTYTGEQIAPLVVLYASGLIQKLESQQKLVYDVPNIRWQTVK